MFVGDDNDPCCRRLGWRRHAEQEGQDRKSEKTGAHAGGELTGEACIKSGSRHADGWTVTKLADRQMGNGEGKQTKHKEKKKKSMIKQNKKGGGG